LRRFQQLTAKQKQTLLKAVEPLSLQHQLETSHPTTDGLHVYAKMTNEDTTPKVKAFTEVSTTEAKDVDLVKCAAIQAVKEKHIHMHIQRHYSFSQLLKH